MKRRLRRKGAIWHPHTLTSKGSGDIVSCEEDKDLASSVDSNGHGHMESKTDAPTPQKKEKFSFLLIKAAGITALAFLLSSLLSSPFAVTLSALFSTPEKSDFVMSDLYYQLADSRPVRHFEDRLVILDIENANREEIAEMLTMVGLSAPKAVAVDINFELPGDNDSILFDALSGIPSLVLPIGLQKAGDRFEIKERPFFYDEYPEISYGAANFPTSKHGNTVREYAKWYPMKSGEVLLSFPEATAKVAGFKVDPPKTAEGDVSTGLVTYHSKEIVTIPRDELYDRLEELEDKIVLVGSTTEVRDTYSIPLRHGVSGVEIHAFALSTILDGVEMRMLPGYIATGVAIVICYMIVLGAIAIKSGIRGLFLRLIQVIALYLIVRIGYSLFADKGIVSDFSQAVLMIAFGIFSVDVWNGTGCLIKWMKEKWRALKKWRRRKSVNF